MGRQNFELGDAAVVVADGGIPGIRNLIGKVSTITRVSMGMYELKDAVSDNGVPWTFTADMIDKPSPEDFSGEFAYNIGK